MILEVISSLLQACLASYTSKTRQCRLGYDTSVQCDDFQLGQFTKFLIRTGFLQFATSLSAPANLDICRKDISEILTSLRACPSYQLDSNHSHCGPRKQFVAGLRFIESFLGEHEIGLCLECWNDRKSISRSWKDAKRVIIFNTARAHRERLTFRSTASDHAAHASGQYQYTAQDFFTAERVEWNLEGHANQSAPSGVPTNGHHTMGVMKTLL